MSFTSEYLKDYSSDLLRSKTNGIAVKSYIRKSILKFFGGSGGGNILNPRFFQKRNVFVCKDFCNLFNVLD